MIAAARRSLIYLKACVMGTDSKGESSAASNPFSVSTPLRASVESRLNGGSYESCIHSDAGGSDSAVGDGSYRRGTRIAAKPSSRCAARAATSELFRRYPPAAKMEMLELPSAGRRRVRKEWI